MFTRYKFHIDLLRFVLGGSEEECGLSENCCVVEMFVSDTMEEYFYVVDVRVSILFLMVDSYKMLDLFFFNYIFTVPVFFPPSFSGFVFLHIFVSLFLFTFVVPRFGPNSGRWFL